MINDVLTQLPTPVTPRNGDSRLQNTKATTTTDEKPLAQTTELSEDQQDEVKRLKKVDQETRAHEAAHKNAGGQFAGSASYSYTVGPDGQRYATGGEVQIDVAPVKGDPEATLAKLDVVIAAALAPAKPSAQDRKVAAAAIAARNKAQAELLEKNRAEQKGEDEQSVPFDVNNFGDTPIQSVNKAYETGLGLSGGEDAKSGLTISVSS